jgi:hypothetical protein
MNPECRAIESQDDPDCPCCVCGKESDDHIDFNDGTFLCTDCEIKDLQSLGYIVPILAQHQG